MIRRSFVLLDRVSNRKEQSLWKSGIKTWDQFWKAARIPGIAPTTKFYYDRRLQEAQQALQEGNSSYFVGKLPGKEMWRLYQHFRDECCFLDIETDMWGKVTVVGISNYYDSKAFVRHFNLDAKAIAREIQKYKVLITFNGSSFDLPKLRKQLGIIISVPHIDLKPLCVNLGLKGGLKEVERRLNLKRPEHLLLDPVACWENFQATNDGEQLQLLVDYNKEDIENLKGVMEWCYRALSRQTLRP